MKVEANYSREWFDSAGSGAEERCLIKFSRILLQ